jgi:hypothetical protein
MSKQEMILFVWVEPDKQVKWIKDQLEPLNAGDDVALVLDANHAGEKIAVTVEVASEDLDALAVLVLEALDAPVLITSGTDEEPPSTLINVERRPSLFGQAAIEEAAELLLNAEAAN